MEFNFADFENEVKNIWKQQDVYCVERSPSLPKYYVLDMFPYPSGAGLHVGHPLGYIASDIIARYKRLKGFNVLHPMGFDSFGLPAEQYAIQTGQHPAITTETNIQTFKEQLDKIGFSFDWSREFKTSDPEFYKWTQWIFIKLFHSWYDKKTDHAQPISALILEFQQNGNKQIDAACNEAEVFNAEEWKSFSAKKKSDILLNYRLAYIADSWVNWCSALGTVLANDEVKDGVSERGGYPVERKLMKQWSLRITAYAERLLNGLKTIDWSSSLKEMQENWIGKSEGCSVRFEVAITPLPRRGAGGEENMIEEKKKPRYLTGSPDVAHHLQKFAAANRKNQTAAEKQLWELIRDRKLGYKFRRQHPVEQYVVDFVCLEKKLVVELDGEGHKELREHDLERTRILNKKGYEVMRFWNDEVMKYPYVVARNIKSALFARAEILTPSPSPKERGADDSVLSGLSIEVFTTRPDTIFGATYVVLAPEHELVNQITAPEYKKAVEEYVGYAKNRSERDRMTDVKKITGQFTGAYAIHPFSKKEIPIWIGEYVLATYGTGAVMAVPGHDERDHRFASHFELPILSILKGVNVSEKSFDEKEGIVCGSDFLDGLEVNSAIQKAIEEIEKLSIGKRKVNYKLRDAIFGRQRYWGEPIPIYYDEEGIPHTVDEKDLPVVLPEVDKYLPTETGEPPLKRASNWKYKNKYEYELTTMPGWAGSSWYYMRYYNPENNKEFASKEDIDYWQNIDLYVGGDEHATGHLLYFRFWTKFLFDLGLIPFDEPAKKLVNQGKIQGRSCLIASVGTIAISKDQDGNLDIQHHFASADALEEYFEVSQIENGMEYVRWFHIPTEVHSYYPEEDLWRIDINSLRRWRDDFNYAKFENNASGDFFGKAVVEKMSKSKYNVINPNEVVEKYGADAFRLYEMFLGPLEQHKPWDTKGIDGTFRFLKKFWRLFYDDDGKMIASDDNPSQEELKILHRTIKKIEEDVEKLSFNTSVSAFMICVNELSQLNSHKRKILEPLLIILSPFAPFITEKLWKELGHKESIVKTSYPKLDASLLVENSFEYPVAVNGKTKTKMNFALDLPIEKIEQEVISAEALKKYFEGKTPKKVIVVKGRMINVVV